MTAITCQSCYTRYVPPPEPMTRYQASCPECRDKTQHTAIDTDLLSDVVGDAIDLVTDMVDELWED